MITTQHIPVDPYDLFHLCTCITSRSYFTDNTIAVIELSPTEENSENELANTGQNFGFTYRWMNKQINLLKPFVVGLNFKSRYSRHLCFTKKHLDQTLVRQID